MRRSPRPSIEKIFVLLVAGVLASPIALLQAQQTPAPIPLEKEPHHELVFRNKDFLAFRVKMPPGDALLLHSHAYDEAALTISSGTTAAIFPGKPEVHQTDVPATLRFHHSGTVHQIRNLTDKPYYLHYSISLLHPQKNVRSLCAAADDGGPVNCHPSGVGSDGSREPQYQTDQLLVEVLHLNAHHHTLVMSPVHDAFLVAIDDVKKADIKSSEWTLLKPGDFLWIPHGDRTHTLQNDGDHEARVAIFWFRPEGSAPFGSRGGPNGYGTGF